MYVRIAEEPDLHRQSVLKELVIRQGHLAYQHEVNRVNRIAEAKQKEKHRAWLSEMSRDENLVEQLLSDFVSPLDMVSSRVLQISSMDSVPEYKRLALIEWYTEITTEFVRLGLAEY